MTSFSKVQDTQGCSVPDRDGPCRPVVWPCRTVPGRPGPQTPHFYWPGPASPTPHFYRQGLGQPGPQPLTFIDRAQASPAQPSPQTLTSIGQTRHFYLPGQAAPCRTVSDRVGPCRHRAGPCRAGLGRIAVSAWHWHILGNTTVDVAACGDLVKTRSHCGIAFGAYLRL